MSEQIFSKKLALCLGVLAVIFSLSYLALAWQDPQGIPPAVNVALPINVSTVSQAKLGAFGVGGVFTAYGGNSTATFSVAGNHVGINLGTTTPRFALEVMSSDPAMTTPLILRTRMASVGTTTVMALTPSEDRIYIGVGCYTKDAVWYNDPIGMDPRYGAKLSITRKTGAKWNAYVLPAGDDTIDSDQWNVAANIPLWNASGSWSGGVALTPTAAARPNCNAANLGMIEFRTDSGSESHFYGCQKTASVFLWKKLDN